MTCKLETCLTLPLTIYLSLLAPTSCYESNVTLQTFTLPGFQGQSQPILHPGGACFNLKSEVKSVKSTTCVLLYTDENCEGYSRKIDVTEEIENLGSDNYFGHFFYQIKSVHACNDTLGGPLTSVDIYEGEYPEGDLLASWQGLTECTDTPLNITTGIEVSMDNHGNCVKIYSEKNCTGHEEIIPAGYHPLYHPLRVIIIENETDSMWKTPIIKSFKPCEKPKEPDDELVTPEQLVWILSGTGAFLLMLIIAIFSCLVWKIRAQRKLLELSPETVNNLLNGFPELLNDQNGEDYVNNFAKHLCYDKSFELDQEQLEVHQDQILGSGQFGIVFKGTVIKDNIGKVMAAVKALTENPELVYLEALVSELKMMIYIGAHPNIVNLLGAQTARIRTREVYIALEFCDKGSVKEYLKENQAQFGNGMKEGGLNFELLVKWAYQVCTGMEFLSKKHVIHGDLAARNILLTEDLTAKISDFGLSRKLVDCYDIYVKTKEAPMPWKWLAVECLQESKYSVKSDVWAYGILLFEIFSLGKTPYMGSSYSEEFIQGIMEGTRPNRPDHASDVIYSIMEQCWKREPEDRPDFSSLRQVLRTALDRMGPYAFLNQEEDIIEGGDEVECVSEPEPENDMCQVKRRTNVQNVA